MNVLYVKKIVICLYILFVQFCYSTPYKNYSSKNNKNSNNGNDIAVAVQKNKNTAPSRMGCFHNNTMFADTSIVPTTEPCLLCKCSKRNLVCVRRVCKDQPYPPPRGCILVQKKNSCCPYLSCSKYHVNLYKNSERDHEHINNHYHQQITHEKTLEKNFRADDVEEMNGGCIESGSLYASGSAMYRSSASMCHYCFCINGQQKCVKPKCILKDTKCKPIFSKASCCPIKYDCSNNSTAVISNIKHGSDNKIANVNRRNRSNGCTEDDRFYDEGEKLPIDVTRPCDVCYCIKGERKCTVKKCAPIIRGCVPKIHTEGTCCPTSYDCRRSIKFKRESRQNEDEEEEDGDSIDFFSLLFGSDEPKENEEVPQTTTLAPFKSLPPTTSTESSFFDLIRAGLEIIDANADKIDSTLNNIISTTASTVTSSTIPQKVIDNADKNLEFNYSAEIVSTTSLPLTTSKIVNDAKSTEMKTFIASTSTEASKIRTSMTSNVNETKKLQTITDTVETFPLTSTTLSIKSTSDAAAESSTKMSIVERTTSSPTIMKSSSKASAIKVTTARTTKVTTKSSTTKKPISTASPVKINSPSTQASTRAPPPASSTIVAATSKRITAKTVPPTTTMSPVTIKKYIIPSALEHQRLPVLFSANVPSDTKLIVNDESEADTLPNLEIIPFVANDAIKTDKYEVPYRQSSYDNLEKDYFANDKEKPFRYNNKFIHHNYDETFDYVNPHDRIDSGPFYYENAENQFDSFSPPNEQDFLGGFSPKDTLYDEVSTSAKYELPQKHNDHIQKPLDTSTIHEHKSYLTSTEKTPTLAINQTNDMRENQQKEKNKTTISAFKKISSNLTSFIDDLLHANALDERTTTKLPLIISTTTTHSSSTSAPIKSIINDDDFIIKHLKVSSTSSSSSSSSVPTTMKNIAPGLMEIFAKPTNPTMNGLLKLAGCNIYGQMYEVGHVIDELSNPCLECKCLPDIGVGCVPLKC